MRKFIGLLILPITAGCAVATQVGSSWEQDVRAAEERHLAAFRANDAGAIEALLSDDFLVNSPRYDLLDKGQLMALVRSGVLNASSFAQTIENIRRYGDIAVVMGADTVVFAPPAPNAGRTIARRFTDIWRFENGQWRFVARHANPVCFPCIASPVSARSRVDSGAFVMRLGRDTLKVERFLLRDGVLRAESVRRGMGVELQRVDAILNTDGSVARMEARLYAWPVDSATRPSGGSTVYVQGDSTILELGLPPNVQRLARAGRAHILNIGVNPFIFALYANIAAHAPARVGDSVTLQHIPGTLGVWPLTVRRIASNWVTAHSSVMGTMRIRVDSAGHVQELDGIGSSLNFHGERVTWADLDSVARSFDQMNRTAGGVGALSPRDSVAVTLGGANLKIDYSRPSKRGRNVFGGIVPWNRVWRTGANLATHFSTDRALAFGQAVAPPGKYTLFTLPTEAGWTLIVSRQTGQWGTEYDAAHDLVRIPMRVRELAAPVEKFTVTLEPRGRVGLIRLTWDTTEAVAEFTVR